MSLTLLKQRDVALVAEREHVREAALAKLRAALKEHLSGEAVWVYGSILVASRFGLDSDIDIALESEPRDRSLFALQSLMTQATGHAMDICLLEETRLKDKIRSTGERWIASA
jgi:predicted nucleotidyltransferase